MFPPYSLPPKIARSRLGPTFESKIEVAQPRVLELIAIDPDQDFIAVPGLSRNTTDK